LNQNNSNIDKQLQDKFSNFTPVPPTFVWEQIDSKLEAKSKRKRGIIVWSVAASLTVAAISGLMLLMNHNSSNTIQVPVAAVHENASVQKTTQPEVIVPQEEEKINNASAPIQFGGNVTEPASLLNVKALKSLDNALEVVENQ